MTVDQLVDRVRDSFVTYTENLLEEKTRRFSDVERGRVIIRHPFPDSNGTFKEEIYNIKLRTFSEKEVLERECSLIIGLRNAFKVSLLGSLEKFKSDEASVLGYEVQSLKKRIEKAVENLSSLEHSYTLATKVIEAKNEEIANLEARLTRKIKRETREGAPIKKGSENKV
jgi:hypothetical protein